MNRSSRWLWIVIAVFIIGMVAYALLTQPDRRNSMEKLGDAIHDLPQGADKAARQLEDRTPGQRLGDAIKDNTNPPDHRPPERPQ